MYGHCTHLSAGRARWTCGKLNTGKPGFTWGTGRRKLGSLFGAQNLYPCVFTAGKTTIKKTKKVWRQTKSQSVEEQLDLVNFYLRSAIINGMRVCVCACVHVSVKYVRNIVRLKVDIPHSLLCNSPEV